MNAEGGTLFIGVNDEGNQFGLQNDYETLKKQNCEVVIKPSPRPIFIYDEGGRQQECYVRVDNSSKWTSFTSALEDD